MIDRATFKHVKSLSREEMSGYIEAVYYKGLSDGITQISASLTDVISKGLQRTSGIGEKRYNEILANITAALAESLNPAESDKEDKSNE